MGVVVGRWWAYGIFPIDEGWEGLPRLRIEEVPADARLAARGAGWEGDVRGDECAKFLLPGDSYFRTAYVWKQDNNGSCFVVSPVPLAYLEEPEHARRHR